MGEDGQDAIIDAHCSIGSNASTHMRQQQQLQLQQQQQRGQRNSSITQ